MGVVCRPQLPPERMREFVVAAEAAGLDDVWLWEDCFLQGGLTAAAAALAWTGSVRIGLGLMPVPLRNPALAAMEIATLTRLFPGRFVPAAGHGVAAWMGQVGAQARSPLTLLREWVTAVRSLLHGNTVTVDGDYVRLDQVALEWPPYPPPPLLIGAHGPRTLALAGEIADGLVLDVSANAADVRQAVATAAAQRPQEAAAQRPQEVVVYVRCQGSASDVADTIRAFADAGATAVILQPAAEDLDFEATIQLVSSARARSQHGAGEPLP